MTLLIISAGALFLGALLFAIQPPIAIQPPNPACNWNSTGNTNLPRCEAYNEGQCNQEVSPRDFKHPSHVFYSRKCNCKECMNTYHKPDKATNSYIDGSLPPCFIRSDANNSDWWMADRCCLVEETADKASEQNVVGCLTPLRNCCENNGRVLFLLGDSHAGSYLSGVIAALQGRAEVV